MNVDRRWELHEDFFVNLSAAQNATSADAQAVGTILSDDIGGVATPYTNPNPNPPVDSY